MSSTVLFVFLGMNLPLNMRLRFFVTNHFIELYKSTFLAGG